MNLNTFARHGVFENKEVTGVIAARLRSREEIERARVFPYQLLVAFYNCDATVPSTIRTALEDAMEVAIGNVPVLDGTVVVCPDVSGSMSSPITGHRKGATTAVRCVDVAALMAATILRKNPAARVLPFNQAVVPFTMDPHRSVMSNAARLADIVAGGTSCSAPLKLLNRESTRADLVILVSDNQSWADAGRGGTPLMKEWERLRERNPKARMVCLDVQPYATTQAVEREDILNIGGFSDRVFDLISAFAAGELAPGHWVGQIEEVAL